MAHVFGESSCFRFAKSIVGKIRDGAELFATHVVYPKGRTFAALKPTQFDFLFSTPIILALSSGSMFLEIRGMFAFSHPSPGEIGGWTFFGAYDVSRLDGGHSCAPTGLFDGWGSCDADDLSRLGGSFAANWVSEGGVSRTADDISRMGD